MRLRDGWAALWGDKVARNALNAATMLPSLRAPFSPTSMARLRAEARWRDDREGAARALPHVLPGIAMWRQAGSGRLR